MRGKRAHMNNITLKKNWITPYTTEQKALLDNGLRIFARWIARAYMKDQLDKNKKSDATNAGPFKGLQTLHPEKSCSKEAFVLNNDPKKMLKDRLGLTVNEAAALLGLDSTSVYKAVKIGQIPSVKFGKRIVIPKESLVEILSHTSSRALLKGLHTSQ